MPKLVVQLDGGKGSTRQGQAAQTNKSQQTTVTDNSLEEDPKEELEDESARSRRVLLELLSARHRRKKLGSWMSRRVEEMCVEDEVEPDSEDDALRSSLVEALGGASLNLEANLSDASPERIADTYQLDDEVQDSCCSSPASSRGSSVSFADSSSMYLMRQIPASKDLMSWTSTPSWHIEEVVDVDVFFSPSAPLRKWKD